MAANDPLLQPYKLKHLTLRNRIMTTAHEPAYSEDGLPKERYRAYHVARAKGGIALTMTAGSASTSRDSPPVFNNVLAYKDEVVPWMRQLADACHEHGAAVMIQLTHLGRRTRWDTGDWMPVVSPSHRREAAHRSFPKEVEDWDIERIIKDFDDAAERMKAAGLDGIELEAYGHLLDQFWSPLTNDLDAPYGGSLDNRLRFSFDVLGEIRERVGPNFIVGVRYTRAACRVLLGGLRDARLGGLTFWTQPNSWHHVMADHAVTFCVLPLGPDRTLLRTTWLIHKDAVEGVDYDPANLLAVWEATNRQDAALVEMTQAGVVSPSYEPGPYSPFTEGLVEDFCQWYVERMGAGLRG